jgi:catechol 2,3-dioxygenase-like lactoylglutathione lyase family enzyme
MLLACSHLVIATADVPRMTRFFSAAFGLEPHLRDAAPRGRSRP